jgi:hypothetical protein
MGPLGLGNATFDSDKVNLTIIVPALPFGFEIRVSTSGASQNGVMSGKISSCCEGSWACCGSGGGGGFISFFTWLLLVLLGVGYVICGGARG